MASALLEVEIYNKITNIGALAEEKAALSGALGGGGTGGGGGIFLGAPGSGAAIEKETAVAGKGFRAAETELKNATIVAGQAGSITDGLARKMSALGQLGITPMTAGLIGAVVGVGLLVSAGKSMLDNADQQEAAVKSLQQAYSTLGEAVPTKEIGDFIDKNARFVGSMYDAEQGFASLARAGFNNTMQLRLMNDALDLSGATGKTLSDSITILTASSTGMSRGLLELGISQKEINAAMAKGSTESQKYEALLKLLESRIKGARNNTSELKQSSSELSVTWDKLSNDNAPGLAHGLAVVIQKTDDFLNALRHSEPAFASISGSLVGLIQEFHNFGRAVDDDIDKLMKFLGIAKNTSAGQQMQSNRSRGFTMGR